MAEELTYEKVQSTLNEAPAAIKALAAVFQQAASDYVRPLETFLEVLGVKENIPASWLVQPVLTLVQKQFGKISREDWIALYDDMEKLEAILEEYPEIRENYYAENPQPKAPELPSFDDLIAGLDLEAPEFG